MRYLLDSNACIAILKGSPESVQRRLREELHRRSEVFLSAICSFELWYGVAKSTRREFNRIKLDGLLSGALPTLAFENEDAMYAGEVRARLEEIGRPAGAYDVLIAGQAIRHELVLVTANTREFARIKGLKVENWA
jgi:tRNA(fMet)-specific endonuclease VapC